VLKAGVRNARSDKPPDAPHSTLRPQGRGAGETFRFCRTKAQCQAGHLTLIVLRGDGCHAVLGKRSLRTDHVFVRHSYRSGSFGVSRLRPPETGRHAWSRLTAATQGFVVPLSEEPSFSISTGAQP
jgi:hypothetical protein